MTESKKQSYQMWSLIEGALADLALESVRLESGDVVVAVQVGAISRSLQITFESPVLVRSTGESFRLRTLHELAGRSGLLRVTDSELVTWLLQESAGVLADRDLQHYLIVAIDDLIDVVTLHPPSAAWC